MDRRSFRCSFFLTWYCVCLLADVDVVCWKRAKGRKFKWEIFPPFDSVVELSCTVMKMKSFPFHRPPSTDFIAFQTSLFRSSETRRLAKTSHRNSRVLYDWKIFLLDAIDGAWQTAMKLKWNVVSRHRKCCRCWALWVRADFFRHLSFRCLKGLTEQMSNIFYDSSALPEIESKILLWILQFPFILIAFTGATNIDPTKDFTIDGINGFSKKKKKKRRHRWDIHQQLQRWLQKRKCALFNY